jgi:hypothetical protein
LGDKKSQTGQKYDLASKKEKGRSCPGLAGLANKKGRFMGGFTLGS